MKLEEAIKSNKFKSEAQKAGLNILYTAWWLKTMMSRELKEHKLTHEQFNVMRILKGSHPDELCVRDIASRMIEKNSNVPRIVDRLVIKKWVKRSVSQIDKRETVIALTASGIKVLDGATTGIDSLFDKMVPLTKQDASSLNTLLEKTRVKEE